MIADVGLLHSLEEHRDGQVEAALLISFGDTMSYKPEF